MTYTAYTAVIFTFHHLSAAFGLFFSLVFFALSYWLFIRRREKRGILMAITYLVSLIVGCFLAEELLQRKPVEIELVRAG